MTEDELQTSVIDLAHVLGWRIAHFRSVAVMGKSGQVHYRTPVQADGAGFPDLVLARERIMYVELKAERGKLSHNQMAWLGALEDAGGEMHVWKPRDWLDGTIQNVLSRKALGR
jgi:hypothetical protein